MSRSRRLTVGTAASAAALGMAMGAKLLADELVGTRGIEQIARDQKAAERSRGEGKRHKKAAVDQLVKASQASIVLGHIHPRWLRDRVERELEKGEDITSAQIDHWRKLGPSFLAVIDEMTTPNPILEDALRG